VRGLCSIGRRLGTLAIALAIGASARTSGQTKTPLHDHAAIQYLARPTTDRVATLNQSLAHGEQPFPRDPRTGYLRALLASLGMPVESQLLVFSKTGVQRAHTDPHTPRALYFDESVVVGYAPDAPQIEVAAHDPQQGVVFYTIDQSAATPVFTRQTSCLGCHVSESTLDVPGVLARSHIVGRDGTVMLGAHDVDHRTPHPDRWGGWYVTSEGAAAPYPTRSHLGNITFAGRTTSDEVFVDWLNSAPETRGYLSGSSDVVSLLAFDHQMHAINLLTRLNWESRVAAGAGSVDARASAIGPLVDELADYLLFVREARLTTPLVPRAGFAQHLAAKTPKDHLGRSFGQLELVTRLLKYPCSYMVYSDAFDALTPDVKAALYRRMIDVLSNDRAYAAYAHVTADDRRAVVEILRATKTDFPQQP
jgi:hypothetical protein